MANSSKHKESRDDSDNVKRLKREVESLKSELESKNIVIDALVQRLKDRATVSETEKKSNQSKKKDKNAQKQAIKSSDASTNQSTAKSKENGVAITTATKKPAQELPGISLVECDSTEDADQNTQAFLSEVHSVFTQKSKKMEFKANFNFSKLVEYSEKTYEFNLANKKVTKFKNPMNQFLQKNLEKIIKFLIDNINSLNLNQVCSTFFLISGEIEYKHKLVVFHDILLTLKDIHRLNFIASALFNNRDLECDLFSQIIKKIMYHQLCIDASIFTDNTVQKHYSSIKDNFVLSAPDISLWESLSHFLTGHALFEKDTMRVKPESIEKGFTLRMMCHYLDWDHTYNTFIREKLYPKIISEMNPIHVYYLGILMINARRLFGSDTSVCILENEMKGFLLWKNECSVASYLILKQVLEAECDDWLLENTESIKNLGFDVSYLKSTLLI